MMDCFTKLKELIENVVLADIEDQIDEIFEQVTKDKNNKEKYQEELNDLQEMRAEFNEILNEIASKTLAKDECKELYEEIFEMISTDDEDELVK
jgi:Mg2+ and Co2+ transporter CorA